MSALALMKMTAHCKRGGDIEVMGMLQGYAKDDAFIVLDVFELPVEGTETRVNAQAEAYEYMVEYTHTCKAVGRHPSCGRSSRTSCGNDPRAKPRKRYESG